MSEVKRSVLVSVALIRQLKAHLAVDADFFPSYGKDYDSPKHKAQGTRAGALHEKLNQLVPNRR